MRGTNVCEIEHLPPDLCYGLHLVQLKSPFGNECRYICTTVAVGLLNSLLMLSTCQSEVKYANCTDQDLRECNQLEPGVVGSAGAPLAGS